jgi:hypothetical protein
MKLRISPFGQATDETNGPCEQSLVMATVIIRFNDFTERHQPLPQDDDASIIANTDNKSNAT